jgi:pyrroline-5-carboxylate reductase
MGETPSIGFIGAGKMATALAGGWLRAGLARPDGVCASDPLPAARDAFAGQTGVRAGEDNAVVLAASDVVVLAVKPQHMADVIRELRQTRAERPAQPDEPRRRPLFISIAAGVTLQQLAELLGAKAHIIRVMPNTPCLVGASASAFAANERATPDDIQLTERLFNGVGRAFQVPEKLLDAVTGLSGSGPAFVFVMIEALSDGGVRMGLPRELATQLAAQTVLGAAKMVLETGQHPGPLKDMVASPAGTTIAGLHALERGGVRAALIDAVEAAARRAAELAQ